jgi:hypothetical protein
MQGEETDGYISTLRWIRETVDALNLPRGTWYRIVEEWPTQGVVKMAAKLVGEQGEGAPPGNRRFPQSEDRVRNLVWHVKVSNSIPENFNRIYEALSQGAAELRRAQAVDGPIIWAVERTVEHSQDGAGNDVESNIIRVIVPVARVWLALPYEEARRSVGSRR